MLATRNRSDSAVMPRWTSAKYGGRYGDTEGYLSLVDQAYRESKELINSYQLNSKSRDNIQVQVNIVLTPVFELFSQDIKFSWDRNAS